MKFLAVDIGTGTQDVLLFDSRMNIENSYKLILPSPTLMVRRRIQSAAQRRQDILLSGVTMGGGPSRWAVEDALKAGCRVFATPAAARTLDDDLEQVSAKGVILVSEEEAARLPDEIAPIATRDIDLDLLRQTFALYGIGLDDLAAVAVAVFDHGYAPAGVSDRKFRFEYLKRRVLEANRLGAFAYRSESIPPMLTRMQAVADSATGLSCPLVVMDTAPAAVLGATFDPRVPRQAQKMIVNIGNAHTLAFRLADAQVEGIFEHHTGCLNRDELEVMLVKFAENTLSSDEVFRSNGHGALLCTDSRFDLDSPGAEIVVTGPRRGLMLGSSLRHYFAAPFGDMMVTGCYGLLAAAADLLPEHAETIKTALHNPNGVQVSPWEIE